MFKPQTMNKVELIVPEHDVIAVTEALAASNVFHLTKTGHLFDEHDSRRQTEWHERSAAFTALEQRVMAIMKSLGVEEGVPPVKSLHPISPNVAQIEVEHLEETTRATLQELEHAQQKLAQLQRYLGQLEPVADLDVDLDTLRDMRYTFALLGTMPITNIERLKSSLEHIPFALVPLHHQEHLASVVLFGLQRDSEILNRAARSAYLNPLKPPEMYRGTPAEAIEALKAGIERTQRHIEESQAAKQHLLKLHIRHLRHLLWRVRAGRNLVETIAGYDHLHYTYLITGWVPAPQMTFLQQKIAQVSAKTTIEATSLNHLAAIEELGEEAQTIPTTFANPRLIRPFQGLVTNYGYPRYDELDPTLLLALTFPLVFGIMFGDVGHGLFLLLVGLLLASKKISALRGASGFGGIIVACGIVAMGFGFLYGSIFGFEDVLTPLWVRPLEQITDVLLVTIGVGAAVLSIGMVCNMANSLLARQIGRLLFDHNGLAGLIFYWSLLGMGVKVFQPALPLSMALLIGLAVISGLGLTFSEFFGRLVEGEKPLIEGEISTYLLQAFFELFETVIGLLSNTLSYVRMGAFAVAHGAISMVVFIMAESISPQKGWGYWVVVVLGNLFVIGFEGMIVGIQTLRLEYYEFFSKFFTGGGEQYVPLSLLSREKI